MNNPFKTIFGFKLKVRSPHWSTVRSLWLHSNPACAVCQKTNNLNVHHIKPFHLYPELELETTNLITLCENKGMNCHFLFGHLGDWEAYNPSIVEDAPKQQEKIKNRLYS
jgi:arsenate reductase-like glutaredoxin family protein